MASQDKYRSYLSKEEIENTNRISGPPNYDLVNEIFEQGRTNIWADGSLEEKVQRLVKTFEMELVHKANPDEYKTVDAKKCFISVNVFEFKRILKFNNDFFWNNDATLRTTYARPRGFALEVLEVYSGPPKIGYKFRHWGFMEGPFKDHAPTGEIVQFFRIALLEVDENEKIVKIEYFFDRGEFLSGFLKGKVPDEHEIKMPTSCPFMS